MKELHGSEYIKKDEEANKSSKSIFVSFNFKANVNEIINMYVQEAVEELGFSFDMPNQDSTAYNEKSPAEMIAKIKSSCMIIADLTHNNSNVYFEAGLAMGMKIPVIWTCLEGHDFSLDTGEYPYLIWNDGEELKKKIKDRIKVVI